MASGKDTYTIQMGKNELEGCQFFLYAPTNRKIHIKISDFTNDKGETLSTELGVEYYIEDGYVTYNGYSESLVYPDAVVPYDSYIAYSSNYENGRYGMDADSNTTGRTSRESPVTGVPSPGLTAPPRRSTTTRVCSASWPLRRRPISSRISGAGRITAC